MVAKARIPALSRPASRSFGESVAQVATNRPAGAETNASHTLALYFLSLAQPQVTKDRRFYHWVKSFADRIIAAMLLVVSSPVMLAIAVAVKMTSPGPVLLVQQRIGKGGKIFSFFKFRSMYNHTDHPADQVFARDYINGNHKPAAGDVFKPAHEKRVTPIGRVLRKASLDELPQFINVLRGDMSIVGPRPYLPYEVDVYRPWHFRRLEVQPGITGLAQIRGRSSLTFKDIVKIDIEYIERRSLKLDLEILLKTVPVVLSGRGAK
jgi:lipopolysaccharide/colanic/teichoic acid biosynthesis glycosyltransferase